MTFFYESESCQSPALSEVGAFKLDSLFFISGCDVILFFWEQGLEMAGSCLSE